MISFQVDCFCSSVLLPSTTIHLCGYRGNQIYVGLDKEQTTGYWLLQKTWTTLPQSTQSTFIQLFISYVLALVTAYFKLYQDCFVVLQPIIDSMNLTAKQPVSLLIGENTFLKCFCLVTLL